MPLKNSKPKERIPISDFASGMRFQPTFHETLMWNALLAAFKPYRAGISPQEPIGPYISDFYISPCNVVVEVDGESHRKPDQIIHDQKRDTFMRGKNIRVMRFKNRQVARNPAACAQYVLKQCLPLSLTKGPIKVKMCPPGSALRPRTRGEVNLFWKG